jgi:hypothetical protein
MIDLFGLRVYLTETMSDRVQKRFPRSKRKRIRRKWAKQQNNYVSVPRKDILRVMDSIYVHSKTWVEFCSKHHIQMRADTCGFGKGYQAKLEERAQKVCDEAFCRALDGMGLFTGESSVCGGVTRANVEEAIKLFAQKPMFDFINRPLPMTVDYSHIFELPQFKPREYVKYEIPRVPIPQSFLLSSV